MTKLIKLSNKKEGRKVLIKSKNCSNKELKFMNNLANSKIFDSCG